MELFKTAGQFVMGMVMGSMLGAVTTHIHLRLVTTLALTAAGVLVLVSPDQMNGLTPLVTLYPYFTAAFLGAYVATGGNRNTS
uniref:(California timema) hypothetical protein n=1 Tax=Timema californicum TaxID=61474 RepID=A0A7R9JDY4_TIMCA|nr:unnamed protein product [Timema californicum]